METVSRIPPGRGPALAGPPGPFQPSVFFRVTVSGSTDTQLTGPNPTVVPLNQPLLNQGGGALDPFNFVYVTPLTGSYHFDYTVLLQDAGGGKTLNAVTTLALEVGSVNLAVPTVQLVVCKTSFSGVQEEIKSLSGSATIGLLAGQTVRLTVENESGNKTTSIASGAGEPLSSFLSGFSLF